MPVSWPEIHQWPFSPMTGVSPFFPCRMPLSRMSCAFWAAWWALSTSAWMPSMRPSTWPSRSMASWVVSMRPSSFRSASSSLSAVSFVFSQAFQAEAAAVWASEEESHSSLRARAVSPGRRTESVRSAVGRASRTVLASSEPITPMQPDSMRSCSPSSDTQKTSYGQRPSGRPEQPTTRRWDSSPLAMSSSSSRPFSPTKMRPEKVTPSSGIGSPVQASKNFHVIEYGMFSITAKFSVVPKKLSMGAC